MSLIEDIKFQFRARNVLLQLIIVNVAVFLFINLIAFLFYISGNSIFPVWNWAVTWLAMPYEPQELLYKPWTLITHCFFHAEFAHIFWNMIALYVFGKIFTEYAGNNRILSVYIYGALCGAVLSFISYQYIPRLQFYEPAGYMLGASGGIMAVVTAAATLVPNALLQVFFIGNVRLKYIALFFVAVDVISLPYYNNTGGHFAHLGGALLGFVYMSNFKKGRDWSKGFNRVFEWSRSLFSSRPRMKVIHTRPKKTDEDFNYERNRLQQRVDEILDKISRSGYESLTKEEKEILFKSGDKL